MRKPPLINSDRRNVNRNNTRNNTRNNANSYTKIKSIFNSSMLFLLISTILFIAFTQQVGSVNYMLEDNIVVAFVPQEGMSVYMTLDNRTFEYLTQPGSSITYAPKLTGTYVFTIVNTSSGMQIYNETDVVFEMLSIVKFNATISTSQLEYTVGDKVQINVDTNLHEYKITIMTPGKTYEYLGSNETIEFSPKKEGLYIVTMYNLSDSEIASTSSWLCDSCCPFF